MNQKTVIVVVITALVVLMAAPKLRQLPVLNKVPTI